jgi:hypothetical protein
VNEEFGANRFKIAKEVDQRVAVHYGIINRPASAAGFGEAGF